MGRAAAERVALDTVESILDVGAAMGIAVVKRLVVKGILAIARAEEAIVRQSSIERELLREGSRRIVGRIVNKRY
jgi:hypothetical protein